VPDHRYHSLDPRGAREIGGFLGKRFRANHTARLKDPMLSEQFIRLHEQQNHNDWFWMGEQVGKWLEAATHSALAMGDEALLARVHEILDRLAKSQAEDGYLGITRRRYRTPVRGMQLYEWYYVLLGLLVCGDLLDSSVALETATRLGDYIIRTWGDGPGQFPLAGRYPGNGHDGGEGTLILEPIVRLGHQTGEQRFIDWSEHTLGLWDAWFDASPESNFACGYTAIREFASGERDVSEMRENLHAHTFHMTLLGIAALYEATGEPEYRDVVLGSVDRLAEEWIFLTGGMSSLERYIPRRYYNRRNQIEVCPQHTWLLLLEHALRWTGEARYGAEMERDLFNHFLAAQLADGSNWSYFTPLNGKAEEPSTPNCCNAAGHRIVGRLPTLLGGLRDGAPAVNLYTPSVLTFRPDNLPAVTMRQETAFPSDGSVRMTVTPEEPASFPISLRVPPYAEGARVMVNGEATYSVGAGDFAVVERAWKAGDLVELALPLSLRFQADGRLGALMRGPLVYACFQDAQRDPVIFHDRRGLYPEDVVLHIDPTDIAGCVEAIDPPVGFVGPALSVPGHIEARAPVFSTDQGNALRPMRSDEAVVLHPFVNQGAVGGEYAVFLHHERPETQ